MKFENLEKLFMHELKDLYSAENQILDALPRMIDRSGDEELRSALEEHLNQTQNQVDRLNTIFQDLEHEPEGQECKGMKGLIEEGEEILEEDADEEVRDAGIIAAAQRVEHYEISGYGTAATYAEMLDQGRSLELLRETLGEEKAADQKLNQIAKRTVNPKARAEAD